MGGGDGGFEVFGEPSVTVDPGEEALDHPSPWQDLEADLVSDLLDHLDGDAGGVLDPLGAIGAVGEGELDERERSPRRLEQRDRAVAILNVGRVGLNSGASAYPQIAAVTRGSNSIENKMTLTP